MGFGAPYGALGGMLAMRMLRGGGAWSRGGQAQARSMFRVPEAPPDPQGQTAAHADLDSLTIGGDHPTIVAFLVARTASGTLVYEFLNVEDHATYVFHDPAMSVAQLDLALMLIGFHIEVLAGDVTGIGSRYAEAVRRLPHLARLAARLPGAGHPRRRMAGSARADDLLGAVTSASPRCGAGRDCGPPEPMMGGVVGALPEARA